MAKRENGAAKTRAKHGPLTAERLREVLHYDPETGVFTNLLSRQGSKPVGAVLGTPGRNPKRDIECVVIRVFGALHKAHRLAWLYMTGAWPEHTIDHIDHNPLNNRWSNLRDVTIQHNTQNKVRSWAASGCMGVQRIGNRWQAQVNANKKVVFRKTFDTLEEADAAAREARRIHHPGNVEFKQ